MAGIYKRRCERKLFIGGLRVGFETASPTRSGYAQFYSRSHHAVIRVYDDGGNVIETHEHKGRFKDW
jgi:hypothetical protein